MICRLTKRLYFSHAVLLLVTVLVLSDLLATISTANKLKLSITPTACDKCYRNNLQPILEIECAHSYVQKRYQDWV
jgi:hypothetical protein